MSGAGFTSGPWEASRRGGKRSRIQSSEMGLTIALTKEGWPARVDKANARLIAAAPQLYDAAVDTLDALNRLRDGFERSAQNAVRDTAIKMIDAHIDELETALFKARGEQVPE